MKHPYPYGTLVQYSGNDAKGYVKEVKMHPSSVNQYQYRVRWDKFPHSTIWYNEWEIVPCSEYEDYNEFQEKINDRMS